MEKGYVDFDLDKGMGQVAALAYRPWSVRTLKVRVTTQTGQPALRLRPSRVRPRDERDGRIRAEADNSGDFVISWGGGHEAGPCLKSVDKLKAFEECVPLTNTDTSFIFFNVHHVGPDVPDDAQVTLLAYDETTGETAASITVDLQKPADLPEGVIRPSRQNGVWQLTSGKTLPAYDSRWWPSDQVTYEAQTETYPLTIREEGDQFLLDWDGRTVATITDYTKSVLQTDKVGTAFELFAFDQWSVALRAWFFWLDKSVGDGAAVGMIGRHEIPDAERFDILLRRKDGVPLLACTDMHWREMWAVALPQKVLEATLGMGWETKKKLLQETVLGGGEHAASEKPYNPTEKFIPALAKREATVTTRAKGTEAHLPMLHNVAEPDERTAARLGSSDVRLG